MKFLIALENHSFSKMDLPPSSGIKGDTYSVGFLYT
jgi:hypothetical protein